MPNPSALPVLYSLRRCPYAMRGRMGIALSKQQVLLREIVTKDKPSELLASSPKGTVPVLVLSDGKVIEQSLDVMMWALHQNDPHDLLRSSNPSLSEQIHQLIQQNDNEFIGHLEKYRASVRYRNDDIEQRRNLCEAFISELEAKLAHHDYFFGDSPSLADFAVMPFVSQFVRVEKKWFVQSEYQNVRRWLRSHLESKLYTQVMKQYPLWNDTKQDCLFG
ncbi:Glutathione S-transferase [Vibrio chagasii]|nr:Glutathione S-transferase [Vibrio chagasii]CAH6931624.1 Glutathione S-transferase [Vibrio chagasii]CAH6958338.1 Glutathione S-transferase [Vibrio chagasii]CAH7143677.1 Glutathione S-transferase [Vibrio chagasii]CAH7253104.1 Glutathione S-transferase [Vibrio chagasii]